MLKMNLRNKIIMLTVGMVCGCSQGSLKNNAYAQRSKQVQLHDNIMLGDNEHPRFSPDGTKLIYSSRARNTHKGSQIYELDLNNHKERRVTFSDGDAFDPSYINDNEIIYASTTDEIKESTVLNKLNSKASDKDVNLKDKKPNPLFFPASELYRSDRFGADIRRMTQHPGFDGDVVFSESGAKPLVVYTSINDNNMITINRLDPHTLKTDVLLADKDKGRRYPVLNKEQTLLAFIETDNKTNEQNMRLYNLKTKKTETLKGGEGLYRDLYFAPRAPARLFYSILRKKKSSYQDYYQIESYDLEDKCTQLVLKESDSLFYPTVSDNSIEKIAFVRQVDNKKQIDVFNLPKMTASCMEVNPSSAAKN